ncbi:MAG: glucosyltransferase domain-containing protein, partial [Ruminococcus sp.]|nr:glucosyltransferase domain-containing protein [Candidatus Copronaster equi]
MKNLTYKNYSELYLSFIATFIFGLAAHLYAFTHSLFSHDSLNAFIAGNIENQSKISVGRFMVPVIRSLTRGSVALPWVIGFLALIYISVSVYFVIKIFNMKSKFGIILIAGIMSTNI